MFSFNEIFISKVTKTTADTEGRAQMMLWWYLGFLDKLNR